MKRNLLYFIYYPGHLTHYHLLNLEQLKKYWDVFDGFKVITIAHEGNNEQGLEELRDMLPSDKNTFMHCVYNDPDTWEAKHFLKRLPFFRSGETFYAHCKGISRKPMPGLDMWIKNLYDKNLENHKPLKGKVFSGICGKLLPCPPQVPEPFHFSGSFYWMNTPRVNARMYGWTITPDRYLTERFPAIIARQDECRFDFYSTTKNENFYQYFTWEKILSQQS